MPDYAGFQALGEVLAGGIGTPGAYQKELKQTYSTEEQLQQARRARALAMIDASRAEQRTAITPELVAAYQQGDPEATAALGASVLGSNSTVNMRQLGASQRPFFAENSSAAQAALQTGDVGSYNKYNAAAEGKSYQPTQVLGGAYVADGVTPANLDMVPTLGTLNAIKRTDAAISQGQSRTQAAVARSNRAPRSGGSGAGRPASTASSESAELANARAAVQQGADPAGVAALLKQRGFPGLAKKVYTGD